MQQPILTLFKLPQFSSDEDINICESIMSSNSYELNGYKIVSSQLTFFFDYYQVNSLFITPFWIYTNTYVNLYAVV